MTKRVSRSREADEDLTEIWVYVAADNPPAADRIIYALLDAERRLAVFPESGRSRDDLQPGMRAWVVGSYVVFYRVTPDALEIVRILHGARDLGDTLSDP
ncbi:type II toxin-antitoxin system RelE/ParE family toxin [Phenylobacterium sp.]|uniref:type II toxin-antitoxin system RelE/ParE family toxin n=1 Tax=Phenylobacterium sp. TaxID=1871053 RepID=UPI0035B473BF